MGVLMEMSSRELDITKEINKSISEASGRIIAKSEEQKIEIKNEYPNIYFARHGKIIEVALDKASSDEIISWAKFLYPAIEENGQLSKALQTGLEARVDFYKTLTSGQASMFIQLFRSTNFTQRPIGLN
jgi:hypothetical protein